jgi:uncharacterized protein YabN with tetrapyrrole methylase and pyrophosphatase domain
VFFLAGDVVTEHEIVGLCPGATSLAGCYGESGPGRAAYERMTETILAPARKGERVCAAFYGHPGVFVAPSGEAIRRARREGIEARMLPGVSSLDCLFADLGVDPAAAGLQTYEASDFIRRRPAVERRAALVLWQVGVVASRDALVTALQDSYPVTHGVVVYEASPYPGVEPRADSITLGELGDAELSQVSTLYVPPLP